MSNSKFASIKIVFEGDVRRVNACNSFSQLHAVIVESFPVLANGAFTVKYLDDEEELVTALTDADLSEAYRVSPGNKIPKFVIAAAVSKPLPAASAASTPTPLANPPAAAFTPSPSPSAPSPSPSPAPSAIPSAAASAAASASSAPASFPTREELFALIQEFLSGAYTQTHKALDELPALVNVLLSESTLAAGATIRSVVDTTLAASRVIREHPVVQRLLPLVDHERVQAFGARLLAHAQELAASGQLAALRERALALLSQLPMLVGMLPILLPVLLAQLQTQFQSQGGLEGIFSAFPCSSSSAPSSGPSASPFSAFTSSSSPFAAFASQAAPFASFASQASSACSQAASAASSAASSAADVAADVFSRAFGVEPDGNESEDEATSGARTESLNVMSLQQLKQALAAHGISTEGMIEKSELVERLRQALLSDERRPSAAGAPASGAALNNTHHGVTCDGCNTSPIVGVRWKCSVCPNFDLCAACEARGVHNPTGHPLVKISVPAQPARGGCGPRGWGRGRGGWRGLFNPHGGPGEFPHRAPQHPAGGAAPFLHQFQQQFSSAFPAFAGRGRSHSPHQHAHHHHNWRRPSPQPAAPTSSPSPARTTPRSALPQAQFLRDVTLPDRTPVGLGKTLIKTWCVQNTGSTPWPQTSKLIFYRGDRELSVEEEFPVPGPVAPGATVEVSAVLRTPQQGGRYSVTFHLADGERNLFGPRLWADLLVEREAEKPVEAKPDEAKPVEAAAAAAPAAAAAAAGPESRYSTQLQELLAMGFGLAPASLLEMLEANDGSVPAVLSGLLGQ